MDVHAVEQRNNGTTYEVNSMDRLRLLVDRLGEVQETFSSLSRPSNSRMSDVGLLATEVVAQVFRLNSIITEPDVPLGKSETPARTFIFISGSAS
jgi:hypothetical protein